MTESLERRDPAAATLARSQRSYALAKAPREALELLRRPSNPPVLTGAQAKRAKQATGSDPFFVVDGDGFTLYKPWRALVTAGEALASRDLRIGPAVTGRLTPTARGSRLDVHVRRYAVTPAQRLEFVVACLGIAVFVVAPVAVAGAHPIALGISLLTLFGVVASVLLYNRRQRAADIRELLAIVERTFGPLELPAAGDAPRRRAHPGDS
ncbi:MAG: hypothetical protein KC486_06485 [Myxococcales bacterium]|nr:hypothetical protein [Myxococcales bacterium]